MRQVISTAIVAVIVGALAGATMSAVAQAPAEQAITPAAGINAATVDGKSAVGYTNKKRARRGKLVATNKQGLLPSNIVQPFWGHIKNKPGILADQQISWGEVVGKPAGFADNADSVGYVSEIQPALYSVVGTGALWIWVDAPLGTDVEITIIPVGTFNQVEILRESFQRNDATSYTHWYQVTNFAAAGTVQFKVRTRLFSDGIASVGLANAAKKVRVGTSKNPRK